MYTNIVLQIMSTEVLSVRIRRELKREVERLKLDVRGILERALIAAIEQEKKKRLEEAVNALVLEMERVSEGEWVRGVKECRRGR
jgi:hypothetical protein